MNQPTTEQLLRNILTVLARTLTEQEIRKLDIPKIWQIPEFATHQECCQLWAASFFARNRVKYHTFEA